jgi:hypothetical protein
MEGKRIFLSAARAVMSFICCGSTQKGFSARGGMFAYQNFSSVIFSCDLLFTFNRLVSF